tara:strand:- start:860 stop:1228 length:369 start_codon:yes stop_codon:yes gene_type:complete
MNKNKADYTNTFCFLMNEKFVNDKKYNDKDFLVWRKKWQDRLKLNNNDQEKYFKLMHSANPLVIPRNHKVEQALEAANNDNIKPMKKLIKILEKPYVNQENISEFQSLNSNKDKKYKTFCGT